ncbi:MAG: hypothetical protein KAT77_01585 [Nanoarchaeota archaeon]|nr:hypothetical protein [Nanoarchaeota archaeon]
MVEINPEHKRLIDTIRDLFIQAGGKYKTLGGPDYKLKSYPRSKDGPVLYFQDGLPLFLYFPEGSYNVLGNNRLYSTETVEKFRKLFDATFRTEEVPGSFQTKPFSGPHGTPDLESGPHLKILEKRVSEK